MRLLLAVFGFAIVSCSVALPQRELNTPTPLVSCEVRQLWLSVLSGPNIPQHWLQF